MDKDFINYFIEKTDTRLGNIEKKLDSILKFKWQILGGVGTVAIIVQVLFNVGSM